VGIAFTLADFLSLVASYNAAFWPLQAIAYLLGIIAVCLALRQTRNSGLWVSLILALFWLWNGIVFNGFYFGRLFPLAYFFTVLFVVQGIIFVSDGVKKKNGLSFTFQAGGQGLLGAVLLFYGMIGYPLIEYLLQRGYPQSLPFGMVPCPTTIFTLGLLLWSKPKPRISLIPVLYAISGVVPVSFGIVEDIGLVAAGLACTFLLFFKKPQKAAIGKK